MLLLSVVLPMFLAVADAYLFPAMCPPTPPYRIPCCPSYLGSPCGYNSGRGRCVEIPAPEGTWNGPIDDRHGAPYAYYTHKCECNLQYMGPDCGGCSFNRRGPSCTLVMVQRQEIRQLPLVERIMFFAKLQYCKELIDPHYMIVRTGNRFNPASYEFVLDSYYNGWCFVHYYVTKPFLNGSQEIYLLNPAHSSTAFLTWHRLYMLFLEHSMQRCLGDPDFALVYYDWSRDSGCPVCNNDYFGSNDASGVISALSIFSIWKTVCGSRDYDRTYCVMSDCVCERPPFRRRAGYVTDIRKSNESDVEACLRMRALDAPPYTASAPGSFRSCLEGWVDQWGDPSTAMHNAFHVMMGGTMSQVPIACNDPIFVCHHTTIDKWFNEWIRRNSANRYSYPNNPYRGHRANDNITPFYYSFKNADMLVPGETYGYFYSFYYT